MYTFLIQFGSRSFWLVLFTFFFIVLFWKNAFKFPSGRYFCLVSVYCDCLCFAILYRFLFSIFFVCDNFARATCEQTPIIPCTFFSLYILQQSSFFRSHFFSAATKIINGFHFFLHFFFANPSLRCLILSKSSFPNVNSHSVVENTISNILNARKKRQIYFTVNTIVHRILYVFTGLGMSVEAVSNTHWEKL